MTDGIWKQMEEHKWELPKKGKISQEDIKEAVEHMLKTVPKERAAKGKISDFSKGEGDYINVYEDKETLSFSVKGSFSFTTGIRGFLNMIDVEGGWVYRLLPIRYNGVVLDDKQTEDFWAQTEKMR